MKRSVVEDLNLGWIPIFEEISNKLLKYKKDRKPLVDMLYQTFDSVGQTKGPYMDQNVEDKNAPKIPLDDICPFTLLASVNRGFKKRTEVLRGYANFLGIEINNFSFSNWEGRAEDTIPLIRKTNSWFFPCKFERNDDDIDKLWRMFEVAIDYADAGGEGKEIFIQAYDDAVKVKWNGASKLSQALYSLRPRSYPTLDNNSLSYLLKFIKNGDIKNNRLAETIKNDGNHTGEEYLQIADSLSDQFNSYYGKDKAFIGLSYDAYIDFEPRKFPLNQILYGPPGTGKTHVTSRMVLEILADDRTLQTITDAPEAEKRELIRDEYKKWINYRAHFVTFHQSYGYEEFVEGIKPKLSGLDNSDLEYEVKPGIFRQICKDLLFDESRYKESSAWAIRLGPSSKDWGDAQHQECLDGGYILVHDSKIHKLKGYKKQDLIIVMQKHSSKKTRWKLFCAVGEIVGNDFIRVNDVWSKLNVKWKWKTYENYSSLNLADYGEGEVNRNNVIKKLSNLDKNKLFKDITKDSRHVLIIDEINRGNVSKILGELITLLEEDKRLGCDEELKVTLPYSGDEFSVPDNLYIIGTMNTADRSIAFLDTALRRRFQFTEMMPKPSLLSDNMDGINLQELLKIVNERITEHLDRDHQIGHSHFIGNKAKTIELLANTFRNNICPLLEEYFYDNRKIIPEILNNSQLINLGSSDENWEWADNAAFINKNNYIAIYNSGV